MKNVISFVIFGQEESFWHNIPFLAIVYSEVLPGFYLRFYIHSESQKVRHFGKLKKLEEVLPFIEVKVIDRPYKGTQPTTWRLMPLWDEEVEYCFCRDLDAIPMMEEVRAMMAFMKSGLIIHSIRGYHLHTTVLMAGLCGFSCCAIRGEDFFPTSFDDYERMGESNVQCADWVWGCDQELLRRFFMGGDRRYLIGHTLDTPLGDAPINLAEYHPIQFTKRKYMDISFSETKRKLLKMCDDFSGFPGQPLHVDKPLMDQALGWDCDVAKKVREVYHEGR